MCCTLIWLFPLVLVEDNTVMSCLCFISAKADGWFSFVTQSTYLQIQYFGA